MREITPITAKGVISILHPITKGRLMKLCEKGTIKPWQDSTGQGTTRLFDFKNLVEIAVCEQLHHFHVHSLVYDFAMRALNDLEFFDPNKRYLVLTASAGRALGQNEKMFLRVATWDDGERDAYFRGYHVNGLIQGRATNLMIIDLDDIRRNLESFFDAAGNLHHGIEE
ncbi:MAG: hypothetical protein H0S80_04085 [Desulfovibrionaceae bacterium]|nr:hypothetical protein [Desulfovibrionaceae bacterium]